MFIMEMPAVPAQETPILLAQAGAASAPQPDFILNDCQGTASAKEFDGTALRAIDPGYALFNALNGLAGKQVVPALTSITNITLLEGPKHGGIVAGTSTSGRTAYRYDPIPDYVGEDRAVFMADYDGKHYKIVVNLKVSLGLNNELCPDTPYQLEKITKPSSGASSYGDFALGTISVTFADLPEKKGTDLFTSAVTIDR